VASGVHAAGADQRKASAETLMTIAADPKHLGARIGLTAVLHTWGSALTHHPHIHMIVPGGGISLDGKRRVSCRPGFFLPVRVLSRLFRRLLLDKLTAAHQAGLTALLRRPRPARQRQSILSISSAAAPLRLSRPDLVLGALCHACCRPAHACVPPGSLSLI
jgi:hypothetical protein